MYILVLPSTLDTLLKLSKTTSPQKLFDYRCMNLYHDVILGMDMLECLIIANSKILATPKSIYFYFFFQFSYQDGNDLVKKLPILTKS